MLEISALSKTYGGEGAAGAGEHVTHVLDAVSFNVAKNQFVCLLGASGCGETTLLRIVAGLTVPDGGEIQLEGRSVTGPGQDRSLVFQNYVVLLCAFLTGKKEFGLEMLGVRK